MDETVKKLGAKIIAKRLQDNLDQTLDLKKERSYCIIIGGEREE